MTQSEPTSHTPSEDPSAGPGADGPSVLILIAHGSRDPRWRASIEAMVDAAVDAIQAELGKNRVQLAYMDCTPPTLMEVVGDAVRAGAERIRVLPLFLTEEGHVERNIRPLVAEVRRSHPSVRLALLPPVGQHPGFRELLGAIAVERSD